MVSAAETVNDPGKFTTLITYEWTSLLEGNTLQRNVIFRDGPECTLQVINGRVDVWAEAVKL